MVWMSNRIGSNYLKVGNIFLMSVPPQGYGGIIWPFFQIPWNRTFYHGSPLTAGGLFAGPLFGFALVYALLWRRPLFGPAHALFILMGLYFFLSLGSYLLLNIYATLYVPGLSWLRWPMRWLLEFCSLAALFTGLALQEIRLHFHSLRTRLAAGAYLAVVVAAIFFFAPAPPGFEDWRLPAAIFWIGSAIALLALSFLPGPRPFLAFGLAFSCIALTVNVPLAQENCFSYDLDNLRRDPVRLETGQARVLYLASPIELQTPTGEQSYAYCLPHQLGGRSVLSYRWFFPHDGWMAGVGNMGAIEDEEEAIHSFLTGHLLETLRVAYVMVPKDNRRLRQVCDQLPTLRLDRELNWVAIYRHSGFQEPTFFVQEVRNEAELGDYRKLGEAKLSRVCFAEGRYAGSSRFDGTGRVEGFKEQHGRIRFQETSDAGGFVVVTTSWYPGWHARIDGQEVPLWRVNGSFMGLEVPPGAHEVRLDFWPAPIVVLVVIGFVTEAGLFLFLAVKIGRRLRRPDPSLPRCCPSAVTGLSSTIASTTAS